MKKYLTRIIFVLISAYAVYATWVIIDYDSSNPYDEKEISAADLEKIKRISEEKNRDLRKIELTNKEILDKIASGESPKPPISKSEFVFPKIFCKLLQKE